MPKVLPMSDEQYEKDRDDFKAMLAKHEVGADYNTGMGRVGRGWWPILEDAIVEMKAAGWDGEIRQIKEKFGGLRFYIGGAPKPVHKITTKAEAESYKVCEDCGKPGWCQSLERWYVTLCAECRCTKWKERLDRDMASAKKSREEKRSWAKDEFICPHCEADETTVEVTYEPFEYGSSLEPHKQVTLRAVTPHFHCPKCEFGWTDFRAEDSREKVVGWLHAPVKKYQQRTFAGVATILRRGDMVLMGKRKGAHGAGTWSFPGGGMEKDDATMVAAARRELVEETTILLDADRIKFLAVNDTYHEDADRHWVTLLFEAEYGEDEKEPVLREEDKCEEWRWFHRDDLPSPLFLPVQKFIDEGLKI
jgi:8-oxo-dGTP diphosphatase